MSDTYTKLELVRELAAAARLSRRRTDILLETLAQIAYREARKGFAVPGICRLDVVHRRARQVRNPRTGQILLIAEHDALRVRPVKRAKMTVAPTPRGMVQVMPAPAAITEPAGPAASASVAAAPVMMPPATPSAALAPAPVPTTVAVSQTPATAPSTAIAIPTPSGRDASGPPAAAAAAEEETLISFLCTECRQEIEAPLSMAGTSSECPTCGAGLNVPFDSEPGTLWYRAPTATASPPQPPDKKTLELMKGRTIRIDLSDDL